MRPDHYSDVLKRVMATAIRHQRDNQRIADDPGQQPLVRRSCEAQIERLECLKVTVHKRMCDED
jgi:hypothetical protein